MHHYVTVRHRRVRYLEAGYGRPVLLVHAFPLAADMWMPQLSAVPPGWRLVAPDLRGLGGSARGTNAELNHAEEAGAASLDDYAHDLLDLLDALAIERAVVVGLSMGGYVAFALHRRAAARVEALVLCDTRSQADTDEGRENRKRMLADLEQHGLPAIADVMLPKLLGPAALADPAGPRSKVRQMILGNASRGVADAVRCLMTRPDATPALASITCPTLILVGRDDQLTPVADHQAMHEAIVGSRLQIIDDAGHLSNLERPGDFNRALFGFLEL